MGHVAGKLHIEKFCNVFLKTEMRQDHFLLFWKLFKVIKFKIELGRNKLSRSFRKVRYKTTISYKSAIWAVPFLLEPKIQYYFAPYTLRFVILAIIISKCFTLFLKRLRRIRQEIFWFIWECQWDLCEDWMSPCHPKSLQRR